MCKGNTAPSYLTNTYVNIIRGMRKRTSYVGRFKPKLIVCFSVSQKLTADLIISSLSCIV